MKFLVSAANFDEEAPGTRGCIANPFSPPSTRSETWEAAMMTVAIPIRWHQGRWRGKSPIQIRS